MNPLGPSELQQLTVPKLKALAKELNLSAYSALNKNDLIKAILEATTPKKDKSKDTKNSTSTDSHVENTKKQTKASTTKTTKKTTSKEKKTPDPNISSTKELQTTTPEIPKNKENEKITPPIEPTHIYIDRGHPIPEYCPGTRLRALVRDPGTIFVYWDCDFESPEGWFLTAYDNNNNMLAQFHNPGKRAGRGYFHLRTSEVARVTLSQAQNGSPSTLTLQSLISLKSQIHNLPEEQREQWFDLKTNNNVNNPPAPGRVSSETRKYIQTIVQHSNLPSSQAAFVQKIENAPSPLADSTSSDFASFRKS